MITSLEDLMGRVRELVFRNADSDVVVHVPFLLQCVGLPNTRQELTTAQLHQLYPIYINAAHEKEKIPLFFNRF